MSRKKQQEQGFTIIELITVMVILGVLGATLASRLMPQSTLQLQAGRDLLVSAFFIAQQKAMNQGHGIQISTSGNQIDIRIDQNDDNLFTAGESVRTGGTQYPLQLPGGLALQTAQFVFNRLGHTNSGTVQITKGSAAVLVTVSGTGYAY